MDTFEIAAIILIAAVIVALIIGYLSRYSGHKEIETFTLNGISLGSEFSEDKVRKDPRLDRYAYKTIYTLTKENIVTKMELIVSNIDERELDDVLASLSFYARTVESTIHMIEYPSIVSLSFKLDSIEEEGLTKKIYDKTYKAPTYKERTKVYY